MPEVLQLLCQLKTSKYNEKLSWKLVPCPLAGIPVHRWDGETLTCIFAGINEK